MSPETLRTWQLRYELNAGRRPGVTTEDADEIKLLTREIGELKRANEILKATSMFFAEEPDHLTTK
jgi:transposase